MSALLAPVPVAKFWDNNGFPLFKGKLATYAAGTTTPQATYIDSTQTTPNTNPIILNARGECNLWLDPTLTYKFVLTDVLGSVVSTVDNIPGGFSPSAIAASLIPKPTNTQTLGSASFTWANLYLGASGIPLLDTTTGNILFYARTPAEVAAGVTPVNYAYPPLHAFRYLSSAQINDILTRTASLDVGPALNAGPIAVARQLGGIIILPSGNYLIQTPLNLANVGAVQITLQGAGHGNGVYGVTPTAGTNFYGRTGTQAVIEQQGTHYITLQDFTIYSLLADSDRSAVGVFQSRTTFQASCQFSSLQRLFILLADNASANASRGSICLLNVQAEHGLYDHCLFESDMPLALYATNVTSYAPTYGTLSSVQSTTLNSFRACAFIALTGTAGAMELSAILSTTFLDCYYGASTAPMVGAAVTFHNGGGVISNVRFLGGQCESWTSFATVACDTHEIEATVEFVGPSGAGPIIIVATNNNQKCYGWRLRFGNATGTTYDVISVEAATGITLYGGEIVLDNGLQLNQSGLTALGTIIQDCNPVGSLIALSATSNYSLALATQNSVTFTGTLVGCTTSPTVNCSYAVFGGMCMITIPAVSATSNTTGLSLTGLPQVCQPQTGKYGYANVQDNGANAGGEWSVSASGTVTLYKGVTRNPATFTGTGTKGINLTTLAYPLS